ncbi:hypothetical protein [Nocardia sp. MDA0666]|uniref:hypothetical protein n=1 Tax=Nocardia sp. MDA0666 TaxID=2135448 RepID=UPI0011B24AB9|nr:hypothetical protein [Nocardia sp. MDA0666]
MTNSENKDYRLDDIIQQSKSSNVFVRLDALPRLAERLDNQDVRRRVEEMLGDDVVTVEVDAADILVRQGGEAGLLAVLTEMGRRTDDPDVDYIANRLYEMDAGGELPVLTMAAAIDSEKMTSNARIGLENLRQLRGLQ